VHIVCDVVVLWNTYGDCDNIAVLKGHTGAIMDLHFSTDGRLVCYMPCRLCVEVIAMLLPSFNAGLTNIS